MKHQPTIQLSFFFLSSHTLCATISVSSHMQFLLFVSWNVSTLVFLCLIFQCNTRLLFFSWFLILLFPTPVFFLLFVLLYILVIMKKLFIALCYTFLMDCEILSNECFILFSSFDNKIYTIRYYNFFFLDFLLDAILYQILRLKF